jgi:DNA-binding transcriptional LysR family regulator
VADHLQGQTEAPLSGTLRIAAPYEFASLHLSPVLCDIMQRIRTCTSKWMSSAIRPTR